MKTEKRDENTNQKFLQNVRKALKEFYIYFGKKNLAICIFGTVIATILTVIEPFFMAKTISFIEDFYKTQNFDTRGFLTFLAIWV